MKITHVMSSNLKRADALVVGIHEGKTQTRQEFGISINQRLQTRILQQLKALNHFERKLGETLYFTGDQSQGKVVVVGLGEEGRKYDMNAFRQYISAGVREASGHLKAQTINLVLGNYPVCADEFKSAQAAAETAKLATYEFLAYKSKPKQKYDTQELRIVHDRGIQSGIKGRIEHGEIFARAQILARDLVNMPAKDLTPGNLADCAGEVASSNGLEFVILGPRKIEQNGMGGVLAVSAGSNKEPRFIVIKYRPQGATEHIALVGKGVTFDAGGLSIKPSDSMQTMKCDMAGAAAVIGTMYAITKINPKVNVTAIIPAVENMLGGGAYKLGDVVRFMDGQTAEIHNTDAEGRVILGDALCWAKKEGADTIFDYATLTGACMVALGEHITGIITNNDALAKKVIEASEYTGEKMWQLPLDDELREKIKGDTADFNNTGRNRYGGASTAAAFLEKFVGDTPWVHHDIAGPAFIEKPDVLGPAGGTGVPVRTILHYLHAHYPG